MRVVVTGASGFIGRHVVSELVGAGHSVATLHRSEQRLSGAHEHTQADVLSEPARAAVRAAEVVVHLAGRGDVQTSFHEPFDYSRLNALGTLNVLEAARGTGPHVVLASTHRVYQPAREPLSENAPLAPADPYAVSKLVAEQWCRMYATLFGVPTTVVRLFSVYGPGQVGQGTSGVVSIFLTRALRGEPLEVHSVQQREAVGQLTRVQGRHHPVHPLGCGQVSIIQVQLESVGHRRPKPVRQLAGRRPSLEQDLTDCNSAHDRGGQGLRHATLRARRGELPTLRVGHAQDTLLQADRRRVA